MWLNQENAFATLLRDTLIAYPENWDVVSLVFWYCLSHYIFDCQHQMKYLFWPYNCKIKVPTIIYLYLKAYIWVWNFQKLIDLVWQLLNRGCQAKWGLEFFLCCFFFQLYYGLLLDVILGMKRDVPYREATNSSLIVQNATGKQVNFIVINIKILVDIEKMIINQNS